MGILEYDDLGRGVECAVRHNPDMELRAVFTRGDPTGLQIPTEGARVLSAKNTPSMKDEVGTLVLCGGNTTDLPMQAPQMVEYLNAVDSFDTHANTFQHFDTAGRVARVDGHIGIISAGWDPSAFSLNCLYASAVLPGGRDYTLWGRGVSQGHSDAIRRIYGVKGVRQYTIPVEEALTTVRSGSCPELTTRREHTRKCFVVAEEGADLKATGTATVAIPNYFADYGTTVHFISGEELLHNHAEIPHGGFVIRTGKTGWKNGNNHATEYSLKLDSNPEFTVSVIVAYTRATYQLSREGQTGCRAMFDIVPSYLSAQEGEELRKHLL